MSDNFCACGHSESAHQKDMSAQNHAAGCYSNCGWSGPHCCICNAGAWVNWVNTDHYGCGQKPAEVYNRAFYCPWVTFAFVAIRRECWEELGGFHGKHLRLDQ